VVGYVGADGKGLGGVELSLNSELAGVEGQETYESAPNGSKIPLGTSALTPAKNGLDYQLTLDSELQYVAEQAVAARVRASRAASGFAITMNIKTGEVLAMANYPTFDSSDPGQVSATGRRNRAVEDVYEPGSVEKVLTSAAILDAGTRVGGQLITPDTRVNVPPLLRSGPYFIKDHWVHPEWHALMRGVVAQSSNIGTALLTRQMNKADLSASLKRFGLGARTGIEVPGEAAGIVPPPDMADLTRDEVAFGQAVSVTGIQEAAAIAGIVNGGVYHPPTLLKGATDADGHPVDVPRRSPRQIISARTSAEVRDLMTAVTDRQQPLRLDGYSSMGKTGTAQLANSTCHCYRGYVTSYVSVAPLEDPQLLTYVVVKDPKRIQTGGGVAGPAAKEIMEFALPRYSIKPTTTSHKVLPQTFGGS
jgi:cell division protein FtsI (penicillin-binding protein 3)